MDNPEDDGSLILELETDEPAGADLAGADEESRTLRYDGWLDPTSRSTNIVPYLTRAQRLAITSRAEDIGNLGEVVAGASQKNRLEILAAILGEIADMDVTSTPNKFIAKIRSALKVALPSERSGLREVLIGSVKPRIEADNSGLSAMRILHDKKTAQRGDWKVVVGFEGKMFSV